MSERKKVEDLLAELGRKIDHLIDETKKAGSEVAEGMEDQISKLKTQKEKLEDEVKNHSSKTGEKWNEAREHLNAAAEAMHLAFKAFIGK